ncbi:bifunctional ADP-dependent NAD(P)H-hydrate dehydratase/NAD(P)H-hydrate epimerase [Nafulsella turpanensis]|uniref:bifunctional ADP-dependent NAD(P)H-hydrate dehydratase/NAD(P)H-hydrate epimerase n=1 Tax=Nafulsella turpanensis TaxID=1265690 RepID=UPI000349390C|nr:bifunctional ADP-dependent NAD(P)H-hydrate dehydratase/NAD(P)H-hydrate epimerase [Nafulsella turpanensis]
MSIKILNARQIHEADAATLTHEQITSLELMERAASAFVRAYVEMYAEKRPVFIFCGTGNNGGDGLAIGRLLLNQQYKVQVYIVRENGKTSQDFRENLDRLNKFHEPKTISEAGQIPDFPEDAIIIDALFGTGLSRVVEGLYAEVIHSINQSMVEVVSVDIPSGLYADAPADPGGAIIKADCVITIHQPKLAFMMPENGKWMRKWKMVNIGLSPAYMEQVETPFCFSDLDTMRRIFKSRDKWSHKGDFGKVLLIAGSKGKIGAGVLCARACLRSGAGLLTVYLPACGYTIMQSSVPEAMVLTDPSQEQLTRSPKLEGFDVIGMGPGLGTAEITRKAFKELLEQESRPMVLDADALNLLSRHRELMDLLPKNAILTPHPKEFERLVGSWENDFERLDKQIAFSREHQVVVVLKGAHSSISSPDGRVYFNSTGNPGMATGGTGDVLTGLLTGLLGQQYDPLEAAIMGVFLHGLAADLAAKELGEESLIASDLIAYLPKAYKEFVNPAFTIAAQDFW